MGRPTPEQIADIIFERRRVYDLDTDSLIREASNRFSARALFEVLSRLDDSAPDFRTNFSELLSQFDKGDPCVLIGFDTGYFPMGDDQPPPPEASTEPVEYYLRLVFSNEDAAYYQFHLFPDLSADDIVSASRKRAGAVQHLRLELARPSALQPFVESCRGNPHFLRVEESTADEFLRAPSNAI